MSLEHLIDLMVYQTHLQITFLITIFFSSFKTSYVYVTDCKSSINFTISPSSGNLPNWFLENIKLPFTVISNTPPDVGIISANIPNFEFNELLKLRALGS